MITESLLLRLTMQDLLDRYVAAIDDDRLEEWPGFFTEDCLYEIIPKENEDAGLPAPLLRCDNAAMLRDRVASLRHANIFEQPIYRHMLSGLVIIDATAETVHLRCGYMVINTSLEGNTSVYQAGIYRDRVVLRDGAWRFAEKRVIYDTARVQTLLAYPI